EAAFDERVAAFLEDEDAKPEQPQFARLGGKRIDRLLEGVADEDKDAHLLLGGFVAGVGQDPADLRVAAPAIDLRHQVAERPRIADPAACPALVETAGIGELPAGAA